MGEGEVAGGDVAESVVVLEDREVAVACVVIPVKTGDAVGGDEERFDAIEGDGEGSVGISGDV